jgi:hypothetical protein
MADDVNPANGSVGGSPGNGHPDPLGNTAPGTTRDIEDHTRQDGERGPADAERSKNPNRVDRDNDRRGVGDSANRG